jgi:hypothetical protein
MNDGFEASMITGDVVLHQFEICARIDFHKYLPFLRLKRVKLLPIIVLHVLAVSSAPGKRVVIIQKEYANIGHTFRQSKFFSIFVNIFFNNNHPARFCIREGIITCHP